MLTLDDLPYLKPGTILRHVSRLGANKQPVRCRVNGKVKLWKTRPGEFQIPVKHRLRNFFYITPNNADEWELPK